MPAGGTNTYQAGVSGPAAGDCPSTITVGTTTTLPCLPACDCCVLPITDLFRCVAR